MQIQYEYPDQEYLFPIETKSVRKILSEYSKRHVNPHLFRDAINTHWVDRGLLATMKYHLTNTHQWRHYQLH